MKHLQKSHSSAGYHNMTVALFALLCVLIGGSRSPSPKAQTKTSGGHVAPKTVPSRNGKIAFTSSRDGNYEIYTMEADGSNQTRLTNNPGDDMSPKWSPDGTKIAFLRSAGFQPYEIYVMNADGSNQTRLTNNFMYVEPPDWSPDGTRIVFSLESAGASSTREIFVVNADGTNQRQLTPDPGYDFSPRWSPDGTRIVFDGRFGSSAGIYVINADGSNRTQLTNSGHDFSPRWSPDSSRITFDSYRDGNNEIYVMNADGSNQTRLTNNTHLDTSPEWSPDSTRIVFKSLRDDYMNIYVMNADGTSQTRLTNDTQGYDFVSPIFSPDGTRIMFAYGYSFGGELIDSQIYVVNADGSNLIRLTNTAAGVYEFELDWQALPQADANPIDTVDFFVRQQYRDFLGREPDSDGFANWMATLSGCPNGGYGEFDNPDCDRVHVSAGFVHSHEFQGRGYWILRFGYAGLNRSIGAVKSSATYAEFIPALAQVGASNSPAQEETAKGTYANAFVQRADFLALFPTTMTGAHYVNALESNAQVTLSNKQTLIDALNAGTMTRADVLRNVVESQVVFDKYLIPAFVTMEYFGYLRRDPDVIGYQNWVNTLTAEPNNYRHMIFGFVYSTEYRQRFGTP